MGRPFSWHKPRVLIKGGAEGRLDAISKHADFSIEAPVAGEFLGTTRNKVIRVESPRFRAYLANRNESVQFV